MFKSVLSIFAIFIFRETIAGYSYETKTFTVPVDHFSFSEDRTFAIRYLINDTFWDPDSGPIFFYTGNEGNIELFANNTGFMWEIAPDFKALLVFAEHRYYGKSLPFGNASFSSPERLGYLTSQQALADYVDLITYLNANETKSRGNPVIAFGGSYGGMLAAYIRMKYPHVVAGSIASSAPIWQFTGMTPCHAFARIVTSDFSAESPSCSDSIRKSWSAINDVTSKDEGLKWLTEEWKSCRPLKNESDVHLLKDWLADAYSNAAMVNYPYATDFLAPLPGRPVRQICKHLVDSSVPEKDLLKLIFRGISVYFNYTGQAKCLNFDSDASSTSLQGNLWEYQSCTEMVMPMCQDGVVDMFEYFPWNFTKFAKKCQAAWKVTPRPFLMEKVYGGKRISTASNIIFSNGLLDPWAGGGVLRSPSKSVFVYVIPDSAHHLDLRASDPADPPSVRRCRSLYRQHIIKWIKTYEK